MFDTLPTLLDDVKAEIAKAVHRPTRLSHWVGLALEICVVASMALCVKQVEVFGINLFGTPLLLIGLILLTQGFGVELFRPETVEYQNRPRPVVEGTYFAKPGTGKAAGLYWIVLGLLMCWFATWVGSTRTPG